MLQALKLKDGKRSVLLAVTETDNGTVNDEAPFGWVKGIANAAIKDRYDELVLPEALRDATAAFMLNPVLSFGHDISGNTDFGLPAGSVLKLWQDAQGNTCHYSRWANTPEAQKVRGLYNSKDMRGFSVQFIPLESRQPTPEELKKFPGLRIVITKLDLIELATAVVPVNQGSLTTASKSLASVRKLALPAEGDQMPNKRKLSDEEVKLMDAGVAAYNQLAEGMSTIAMSLDELRAKAGEDDDHAPRIQKMIDGHKAIQAAVKTMGDTCMALGSGFGIKAEGEAVADPNAVQDGQQDPGAEDDAAPEDMPAKDVPANEETAKSFAKAFQAAL